MAVQFACIQASQLVASFCVIIIDGRQVNDIQGVAALATPMSLTITPPNTTPIVLHLTVISRIMSPLITVATHAPRPRRTCSLLQ